MESQASRLKISRRWVLNESWRYHRFSQTTGLQLHCRLLRSAWFLSRVFFTVDTGCGVSGEKSFVGSCSQREEVGFCSFTRPPARVLGFKGPDPFLPPIKEPAAFNSKLDLDHLLEVFKCGVEFNEFESSDFIT